MALRGSVACHCNPPAKSRPMMNRPFFLLQNRTVPLPPNAKRSTLKLTRPNTGTGSGTSIRIPVRDMSRHSPTVYLSKPLVHDSRTGAEHGTRGARRRLLSVWLSEWHLVPVGRLNCINTSFPRITWHAYGQASTIFLSARLLRHRTKTSWEEHYCRQDDLSQL
jgi:hypothetical protein